MPTLATTNHRRKNVSISGSSQNGTGNGSRRGVDLAEPAA
jgi:hypothetical protein